MGSEVKSSRAGSALWVAMGERVTVGESGTEYVVVGVDHAPGRRELLRLNPARNEMDVPASAMRKKSQSGPRLVPKGGD